MRSIHLICRRDDGLTLNGVRTAAAPGTFWSGPWQLSEDDARSLQGGWLYLHPSQAARSVFGGKILGYGRVIDGSLSQPRRIEFLIQRRAEAERCRWRGQRHRAACSSGLVPPDLPHEREEDALAVSRAEAMFGA